MWFEKLTGFEEKNPEQVRSLLNHEGEFLISKVNGGKFVAGQLITPTLFELRSCLKPARDSSHIRVTEIVGNIQEFLSSSENEGAVFQVASQFNLLEMSSPDISPEMGVDRYENDPTQGPACAIACGAGTIYRNYFMDLGTQIGQTERSQFNCLEEIEKCLENYWEFKNGYILSDEKRLHQFNELISKLSMNECDELFSKLRVGIQKNTQVTLNKELQLVTQIFCSAVPISYSRCSHDLWEVLAKGILKATYESTFLAALQNCSQGKSNKLFLTYVGAGAFGNPIEWVIDAMEHSIAKYKDYPLDVFIVSYRQPNMHTEELLQRLNKIL
ncbi:MAG: hypothetical protein LW688_06940 [Cryomorphaceae bacterium]|jgi:hypothetical protein|nr:hypothetical protein [Cryomorphaceae bacterium]